MFSRHSQPKQFLTYLSHIPYNAQSYNYKARNSFQYIVGTSVKIAFRQLCFHYRRYQVSTFISLSNLSSDPMLLVMKYHSSSRTSARPFQRY